MQMPLFYTHPGAQNEAYLISTVKTELEDNIVRDRNEELHIVYELLAKSPYETTLGEITKYLTLRWGMSEYNVEKFLRTAISSSPFG